MDSKMLVLGHLMCFFNFFLLKMGECGGLVLHFVTFVMPKLEGLVS